MNGQENPYGGNGREKSREQRWGDSHSPSEGDDTVESSSDFVEDVALELRRNNRRLQALGEKHSYSMIQGTGTEATDEQRSGAGS